jgi:hypothetical protein
VKTGSGCIIGHYEVSDIVTEWIDKMSLSRPNQSMKPTAPRRENFSVFAIDPARGLSLSR